MPFRSFWLRIVLFPLVGGASGWLFAALWCQELGGLFFQSALQNPRVISSLTEIEIPVILCGAVVGLCLILEKGGAWARAIATGLCIWIGATFFSVSLFTGILLSIWLIQGYVPASEKSSPTMAEFSPAFMLWCNVPMLLGGALLLHQAFRMHIAGHQAELGATIRDGIHSLFMPRDRHHLENIVLESPLSLEECLQRLPQIADIESNSHFAFWEKLPLPGRKKLRVRVKSYNWRIVPRYWSTPFTFLAELSPFEEGTHLRCYSRWIPSVKYFLLLWFGGLTLLTLIFVVTGLIAALSYWMGTGVNPFSSNPLFSVGGVGIIWVGGILFLRLYLWMGKRQEVMVIGLLQPILEAHVVERKPLKLKFGLL